ncbi:ribosome-associated heat shock protein Hsp15 [Saccharospirillum salsuginis]|uniref:Heat shock protein 15 n=1 Tax=Saccharospirillum salsuginis TaxID=418750 RepID=A0A918K8Y9_9GAMM|nr:ribosome-associated heat shock protein Hsp15 [Saccharospirillum salsuginis]GGX54137.1 heat shock protein 15 [Saccharospirillum salsuginis]
MTDTPVRLDKWLWAARFYKTRSLAKEAVEGGKVHYNGTRAKPSRTVEIGALLRMRLGFDEKTVEVLDLSDKRRGAPEAQTLYRETEESIAKREKQAALRKAQKATQLAPDHKPNKKERRDIRRFKDTHNL